MPSEKPRELPMGVFEDPAGSGIYWARWRDRWNREHVKRIGRSVQKAQQFAERKRAERRDSRNFPVQQLAPVLADAIDDTLARTVGECVAGTQREYARAGAVFKVLWGTRRLDELRPGDIERWRAGFLCLDRAPATANRYLAFLKRVYSDAVADGTIGRDHALSRVRALTENNKRTRWLSDEEWVKLMRALPDAARLPVIFAAYTGLRQSEQFRMRWDDVDMKMAMMRVPRSKHGEQRWVPLNATALAALMEQRRRHTSEEWVWPSTNGRTPLDAMNFCRRHFRPALAAAGIRNFRWHDLRHTYASVLTAAGVPPIVLRDLLGHKTLEMTARYSHLAPQALTEAVRRLDRERPVLPPARPRTVH